MNTVEKVGFIKLRSIKSKLMVVVLPFVIVAMGVLLITIYTKSREIIVDYADQLVQSLTISNEHEIENWSQDIISGLNQVKNTIDNIEMDDVELLKYLKTTMNKNDSYLNGVYVGTENQNLYVPSGFVPGSDYIVTERDWYKEGLNNVDKFNFGAAYLDKDTGGYILSATTKLMSVGNIDRVASADVSLAKISEIVSTKSILKTGKVFLIDTSSNKIIAISESELVNTDFNENNQSELIQDIANNVDINTNEVFELQSGKSTYSVCVQSINHTPWKLIGYVSHKEVLSSLNDLVKIAILIFIILLIILIVSIERVVNYIINPLKILNQTIQKITDGDFTVEVKARGNDEIATISRSMQKFIETMRGTIGEVGSMSNRLEQQAENSSYIAKELYESAETQSTSMTELNQTVNELARAVSEVAESTTALSLVVSETGQKGQEASKRMKNTVLVSEKGKKDMVQISKAIKTLDSTVEALKNAVEEVDESSEKINDIVSLIGNIATQTNLLSLNAAIEAARAGEAGKGFAVVADEIRKLAETSQRSVKSISELTSNIKNLVGNTIIKTKESAESIKESITLVNTAEETFEDIYLTVNETNEMVQNMIENVNQVDDVATSVAAITEEQSAAAEEILATSENLANHARKVTENSFAVGKDATELSVTAEKLNKQMQIFKI